MYDAVEVFARCPKGCGVRLVKCTTFLYICRRCGRIFVHADMLVGGKLEEIKAPRGAICEDDFDKCRKVVATAKFKEVKKMSNIDKIDVTINPTEIGVPPRIAGMSMARSLRDLVRLTEDQILNFKHVGHGALRKTKKALAKYGLKLGMTEDEIDAYTGGDSSASKQADTEVVFGEISKTIEGIKEIIEDFEEKKADCMGMIETNVSYLLKLLDQYIPVEEILKVFIKQRGK